MEIYQKKVKSFRNLIINKSDKMTIMEILEYITYGIGVILALGWLAGIRSYTLSGQNVTIQTVNTAMLFIVSLIVVIIFKLPFFHLLWMYPVSIAFGLLSMIFPFSLLSIFGNIIGFIACLGLNPDEVKKNNDRTLRGMELVRDEGLTVDEAKKRLEEEGY